MILSNLRLVLVIVLLVLLSYLYLSSPDGAKIDSRLVPDPIQKLNFSNLQTPSLDQIFNGNHSLVKNLPQDKIRTLIATGDIIPARSVNYQMTIKNNFLWSYEKTAGILQDADLTLVNLETPLFEGCLPTQQGMSFCGSAQNISGLQFAGVDIVSLANNHAGNYGLEGIDKTTKLLDQSGIKVTGSFGPTYMEVRGMKLAFLGYNEIGHKEPGISWAEDEKIKQETSEAKSKADIVVVTFHWGTEYVSQPTKRQKELAHLAVDSGADLIIGNHPHWIQPVEIYKDKIITYAHGNFIFDQMWSEKTREGVLGKYTFYSKQLIDVHFFPVLIDDFGQPHFLEGEEKKRILEEIKDASFKLAEDKD